MHAQFEEHDETRILSDEWLLHRDKNTYEARALYTGKRYLLSHCNRFSLYDDLA